MRITPRRVARARRARARRRRLRRGPRGHRSAERQPRTQPDARRPGDRGAVRPAALPVDGTACGSEGYTGSHGADRGDRTPGPSGSRCASPTAASSQARAPGAGRPRCRPSRAWRGPRDRPSLAGTGPYRHRRVVPGENVRLPAWARATPDGALGPTVILPWDADPLRGRRPPVGDRRRHRRAGPGGARPDRDPPRATVTERDGPRDRLPRVRAGPAFGQPRCAGRSPGPRPRRARQRRVPGRHLRGHPRHAVHLEAAWGPGLVRVQRAGRRRVPRGRRLRPRAYLPAPRSRTRPSPGLPDPAGPRPPSRTSSRRTSACKVSVDAMPGRRVPRGRRRRALNGLYLDGVASTVADAAGFLGPLFGEGVQVDARQTRDRRAGALERAAAETDPAERAAAIGEANTAIRDAAVIVPLAHPGSTVDVPERRRGRGDLAARPRPARGGDARRPAAARVHAGDRARAARGAATSRRWTRSGCAACSRRPVRVRAGDVTPGAAPGAGMRARPTARGCGPARCAAA